MDGGKRRRGNSLYLVCEVAREDVLRALNDLRSGDARVVARQHVAVDCEGAHIAVHTRVGDEPPVALGALGLPAALEVGQGAGGAGTGERGHAQRVEAVVLGGAAGGVGVDASAALSLKRCLVEHCADGVVARGALDVRGTTVRHCANVGLDASESDGPARVEELTVAACGVAVRGAVEFAGSGNDVEGV